MNSLGVFTHRLFDRIDLKYVKRCSDCRGLRPLHFVDEIGSDWLMSRVLAVAARESPRIHDPGACGHEPIRVLYYSSLEARPSAETREKIRIWRPEVLIHFSDEKLRHRSSSYGNSRTVIRGYFNPNTLKSKVFFIPIGYNEDLVAAINLISASDDRTVPWSFFGNRKGDRQEMLEAFEDVPNGIARLGNSGFMKNLIVTDEQVARVMLASHFVLCPFGSLSPDTWRILETLEAGAIPVSVRLGRIDYFRFVFGDHPFIVEETWEEAAQKVKHLLANPAELARSHEAASIWYSKFERNLAEDVSSILQGDYKHLVSPQFRFQAAARWNMKIRFVFWSYFHWPVFKKRFFTLLDELRTLRRRRAK